MNPMRPCVLWDATVAEGLWLMLLRLVVRPLLLVLLLLGLNGVDLRPNELGGACKVCEGYL